MPGQLSELYEKTVALTAESKIARLEFLQVFDAVGGATWVINSEYRVLRINQPFLDLIGLKNKSDAWRHNHAMA